MKPEIMNFETANGDTTAVVARPDTEAESAVVLIHEWWGINDHMRDIALRYAKEGYLCVAPDLFRGKVARNSDEAAQLMKDGAIAEGLDTIDSDIAENGRSYAVGQLGDTGNGTGRNLRVAAASQ